MADFHDELSGRGHTGMRLSQACGPAHGSHGRSSTSRSGWPTDPAQLSRITDNGLCHGWSGLYQTGWRAAHDALTPVIGRQLPRLAELLARHAGAGVADTSVVGAR